MAYETEDQIERRAAARVDALDRAYLTTNMSDAEYGRLMAGIDLETNRLIQSLERARRLEGIPIT